MAREGHVLLLSPMPLWPAGAGNRRRALQVALRLKASGFIVHIAVTDHEDQIYRAFGQIPPNDLEYLCSIFDEIFYVDSPAIPRIRTAASLFFVDDWYPATLDDFADWYLNKYGAPRAVLANYVFYSKFLTSFPDETLKIVDAHDRFANRNKTNRIARGEPNFFYTSESEEARGLDRADLVLAIQNLEAQKLRAYVGSRVETLSHRATERSSPTPEDALKRFGFIGHGNDANVASINRFAHEWAARFPEDGPTLVIAGEVSNFVARPLRNVEFMGYVGEVDDFYDRVDAIVAPILFGTGLKIKVVEALAQDKIVIGTRVAFDGLSADADLHFFDGGIEIIDCIAAIKDDKSAISAALSASRDLYGRYRVSVDSQEEAFLDHIEATVASRPREGMRPAEPTRSIEVALDEQKVTIEIAPLVTAQHQGQSRRPNILIAIETAYASDIVGAASTSYGPNRAHVYLGTSEISAAQRSIERLETRELVAFIAARRFLPYLTRSTFDSMKDNQAVLEIFASLLLASKSCWTVGNLDLTGNEGALLAHFPAQALAASEDNSLVLFEYRSPAMARSRRWVSVDHLRGVVVTEPSEMSGFASLPEISRSAGCESLVPMRLRMKIDESEIIPRDVFEWRLFWKVGPLVCLVSSSRQWDEAKPSGENTQGRYG